VARSTRRTAASSILTRNRSELKGFSVHRPFIDAPPLTPEGKPGESGFQLPLVTFAKTVWAEQKDVRSAGYKCAGMVYETWSEKYSYRGILVSSLEGQFSAFGQLALPTGPHERKSSAVD
jgi:hypothetical protein